ncbi:hypothetical protein [Echinicola strongylocentroti]|uniref:hypothetical protein n=1 Tax=Echinicola strongylocentroti TaxID=1795355 RepID=UPI0013A6BBB1|nr:hypothetical protein [Echinicola strongylocentroti]
MEKKIRTPEVNLLIIMASLWKQLGRTIGNCFYLEIPMRKELGDWDMAGTDRPQFTYPGNLNSRKLNNEKTDKSY